MSNCARWVWLAAVFIVVMSGCAGDPAVRAWWTLGEADFLQFKPRQTTKEEVRARLGKPIGETRFARLNEEVWDYRFLEGSTMQMVASLHFDTRGVFKYYTAEPDPSIYNTLW